LPIQNSSSSQESFMFCHKYIDKWV
jgi:hypothetical protein